MASQTYTYPDPTCAQSSDTDWQVSELPVLRPCGADDKTFLSNPCDQWNRDLGCANDRVYYEPVCVDDPPPPNPPPTPCQRSITVAINEGIGDGESVLFQGITIGGSDGCLSTLFDGEPLYLGPQTADQLAAGLALAITNAGQTATANGSVVTIDGFVDLCCSLGQTDLEIQTAGALDYTGVVNCCAPPTPPPPPCPPGLEQNQARWTFIMYERAGIIWGNGIGVNCTPPGQANNTLSDAVMTINANPAPCALTPNNYAANQTSCHLTLRCATDFDNYVARMLSQFALNPSIGCNPSNVLVGLQIAPATATPVPGFIDPDTGLPANAYRIQMLMDLPALIDAIGPDVCERGFCVFWRYFQPLGQHIPVVPGIMYEENLACCPFNPPPPPDPPDPPSFCVHECDDVPLTACADGPDLMRFHFQMPDNINLWPNANAGWTQTGAPWLATVWVHSEDCCTPLSEEWWQDWMVGTFNDELQFMQNINILARNLPQRFYLNFVFNNGDGTQTNLYTNWYERMCCPQESVLIDATFSDFDCEGNYYGPPDQWFGTAPIQHRLTFRVMGALIKTGVTIEREEQNERITRTTTRERYTLRTEWLPPYMLDRLYNALSSPNLTINGIPLEFTGDAARNTSKGQGGSVQINLLGDRCIIGSECN